MLEKLGVGGPSWEEQERERYRVNIVPVENQLISGQAVEEAPRMLEASDSQRFETERELEYVELEDRRSDNTRERQPVSIPRTAHSNVKPRNISKKANVITKT